MNLSDLIRGKSKSTGSATATLATPATADNKNSPSVAKVASVAVADAPNKLSKEDEKTIRSWLHCIGESEEDHHLVLGKCESKPETLAYFLKHAATLPAVREVIINPFTSKASTHKPDYIFDDDRVLCSDCRHLNWRGYCTQWRITNPHNPNYSPVQDVKGRCSAFKLKQTRTIQTRTAQ